METSTLNLTPLAWFFIIILGIVVLKLFIWDPISLAWTELKDPEFKNLAPMKDRYGRSMTIWEARRRGYMPRKKTWCTPWREREPKEPSQ